MSGICGVIHLGGGPIAPEAVDAMLGAVPYRGRDGVGRGAGPGWCAAHLATHVTLDDLRERQPVRNGTCFVVADARIDNGPELIHRLGGDALEPNPPAATLILAAFRRWGPACVDHLVGDYAFVHFDEATGALFAARDPSGVRSLHYHRSGDVVRFATEVKQLLAACSPTPPLHDAAIVGHLAGGFERPEWTFFEDVLRLPPGHVLSGEGSNLRVTRFWDPTPSSTLRYRRESDYSEHFRELLIEAVGCRTASSRPVGILLSGGVDSGSVASVAGYLRASRPSLNPEVLTYSFAMDDLPDSDERSISDAIVRAFGLTAVDVPGSDAWPLAGYPEHGPQIDSPFAWVYQVITGRAVAQAAEHGVGVLLTGEGGDELVGDEVFDLAGMLLAGRFLGLRREVRALANRWNRRPARIYRSEVISPLRTAASRLPGLGRLAPASSNAWALRRPPVVAEEAARRVGLDDLIAETPRAAWFEMSPKQRRQVRLSAAHLPRILAWQEHLHARHGLGAAMPLADTRLVRFVLSIPPWVVNAPSEPKRLVRRGLSGIMPDVARSGARKVEPLGLYRRGMLERAVHVVRDLAQGRELVARGYADPGALEAALQDHLNGTPHYDLWWALTLEWWLRMYWSEA